ncbi:MAG: zf-HC2 domain-containing protein [Phycisphaerales bacterium]|nr:zf-HC2 domain-containing protein [Phycisphaerales bacterium]
MMNCQEFETLLSDALGGELAERDRPVFETHLAECERCRLEYETSRAAVQSMRELPGPARVAVSREGDRLVIGPVSQSGAQLRQSFTQNLLRYAASVLIAFAAGYLVHAARSSGESPEMVAQGPKEHGHAETQLERPRESLRVTLAHTCGRGRSRAAIVSCMSTLFSASER